MKRTATALVLVSVALGTAGRSLGGSGTPGANGRYEMRRIEGWTVYVSVRLLAAERRELWDQPRKVLDEHLFRITRVLPPAALARVREVPIWVETGGGPTAMCYHPSASWLRDHGMNPNKAGAVEVCDARLFVDWTLHQPWMVLHELAHAYHHQVLGFDHPGVRACYDSARDAKLYESVLRISGSRERAYALTDEKEYFAEGTEAFFGTNDFYPFVRAELKQHDPRLFALLEKLWGVRPRAD
jgi:hypothetical protein